MHQPVLNNEAAQRNTEHQTQAPPEDKRARDDSLLGLLAAREDGDKSTGELEPLSDGLGDKHEEVDEFGHAAAEEAEGDVAEEVPDGAGEDGPLEAAGVCDGEAGEGADDGGDDGGDDEAEAGGGCAGEEGGLEV